MVEVEGLSEGFDSKVALNSYNSKLGVEGYNSTLIPTVPLLSCAKIFLTHIFTSFASQQNLIPHFQPPGF